MIVRIFYDKTKKVLGTNTIQDGAVNNSYHSYIDIDSVSDDGVKILDGWDITIKNNLTLTLTAPDTSAIDKIKAEKDKIDLTGVAQSSDLTNKQMQDLVYLMALKEDLIST